MSQPAFWLDADLPPEVETLIQSNGILPGARILDIGCGDARTTIALSARGYNVTGIDVAQSAIDRARENIGDNSAGPSLCVHDISADLGSLGCFDVLLDRGCLHGIGTALVPAYFRGAAGHLASGGRLLVLHKLDADLANNTDLITQPLVAAAQGAFILDRAEQTQITGKGKSVPALALIFVRV
jgi:SAM-dependent methyltransferase